MEDYKTKHSMTPYAKHLLVLLVLYFNQMSAYVSVKYASYGNLIMCGMFALAAAAFGYAFFARRARLSWQAMALVLVLSANLCLSMAFNGDLRGGYVLLAMNLAEALFFTALFSREEFYRVYVNCLVVLSVLTFLTTYLAVPLLRLPILLPDTGARYYDAWVTLPQILPDELRLNAVWFEPGVYALYLGFALVLELFLNTSPSWFKVGVLTAAMLGTTSSTGYVVLALLFCVLVADRIFRNRRSVRKMLALSAAVLLACFAVAWFVPLEALERTFSKYDFRSLNFIGRFAPMLYNLEQGLRSPLFGLGFYSERGFRVYYPFYKGMLYSNTATTFQFFHFFGFAFPLFTCYASWKMACAGRHKSLPVRLALAGILILNVNFESVVLDQVYMILLFSFFMKSEGKGKKDESAMVLRDADCLRLSGLRL
ncbi:MAG: O-antigen ligase family protein [Clostridium sp.]|nr:O-antigen ligase family protein [Clostridium sp.]